MRAGAAPEVVANGVTYPMGSGGFAEQVSWLTVTQGGPVFEFTVPDSGDAPHDTAVRFDRTTGAVTVRANDGTTTEVDAAGGVRVVRESNEVTRIAPDGTVLSTTEDDRVTVTTGGSAVTVSSQGNRNALDMAAGDVLDHVLDALGAADSTRPSADRLAVAEAAFTAARSTGDGERVRQAGDEVQRARIAAAQERREQAAAAARGRALRQEARAMARARVAAARSEPVQVSQEATEDWVGSEPDPNEQSAWQLWHAVTSLEASWLRAIQAEENAQDTRPAGNRRAEADAAAFAHHVLREGGPLRTLGASVREYHQLLEAGDVVAAARVLTRISTETRGYNDEVRRGLDTHGALRDLLADQLFARVDDSLVLRTARLADNSVWSTFGGNQLALRNPHDPTVLDVLGPVAVLDVTLQVDEDGTLAADTRVRLVAMYEGLLRAKQLGEEEIADELAAYAELLRVTPVKPNLVGRNLLDTLGTNFFLAVDLNREGATAEPASFQQDVARLRTFYDETRLVFDSRTPTVFMLARELAKLPDWRHRQIAKRLAASDGTIYLGAGFIHYIGPNTRNNMAGFLSGLPDVSPPPTMNVDGVASPEYSLVVVGANARATLSETGEPEPGGYWLNNDRLGVWDLTEIATKVLSHELSHAIDRALGPVVDTPAELTEPAERQGRGAQWLRLFEMIKALPGNRMTGYAAGDEVEGIADVNGFYDQDVARYERDLENGVENPPLPVFGRLGELLGVHLPSHTPTFRATAGTVTVTAAADSPAAGIELTLRPDAEGDERVTVLVDGRPYTLAEAQELPGRRLVVTRRDGVVEIVLRDRGDGLDRENRGTGEPLVRGTVVTFDEATGAVRARGADGVTLVATERGALDVFVDEGVTGFLDERLADGRHERLLRTDANLHVDPVVGPPNAFGLQDADTRWDEELGGVVATTEYGLATAVLVGGELTVTSKGNITPDGVRAYELLDMLVDFFGTTMGQERAQQGTLSRWLGEAPRIPHPVEHLHAAVFGSPATTTALRARFDTETARVLHERWEAAAAAGRAATSAAELVDVLLAIQPLVTETDELLLAWEAALPDMSPAERFVVRVALEETRLFWAFVTEAGGPLDTTLLDLQQVGGDWRAQAMLVAAVLRHAPDRFERAELLRFAESLEPGDGLVRNGISVGHVLRLLVPGHDGESLPRRLTELLGAQTPPSVRALMEAAAAGDLDGIATALREVSTHLTGLRDQGVDVLVPGRSPATPPRLDVPQANQGPGGLRADAHSYAAPVAVRTRRPRASASRRRRPPAARRAPRADARVVRATSVVGVLHRHDVRDGGAQPRVEAAGDPQVASHGEQAHARIALGGRRRDDRGVVRRAVVDHEQLEVGHGLVEDGVDGPRQRGRVVEGADEDADARRHGARRA